MGSFGGFFLAFVCFWLLIFLAFSLVFSFSVHVDQLFLYPQFPYGWKKGRFLCLYNWLNCQFIFTFKIDRQKGEEVGPLPEEDSVHVYMCWLYTKHWKALEGDRMSGGYLMVGELRMNMLLLLLLLLCLSHLINKISHFFCCHVVIAFFCCLHYYVLIG